MLYTDKLIDNNTKVEVGLHSTYGFSDKELTSIHSFRANHTINELLINSDFSIELFKEEIMGERVLSEEHSFIMTFNYENVEEVLTHLKLFCGDYYMTTYFWDLKNVLNRFKETISPTPTKDIPLEDISEEDIPY